MGLDGSGIADIAADGADLTVRIVTPLRRGVLQEIGPAATDDQFGAEFDKRRPIAAPSPEPPPVTRIRLPASNSRSNIDRALGCR
jgi:hypothetical protein